jgi:glycosyltransferase involved in cell wall biosynthesis
MKKALLIQFGWLPFIVVEKRGLMDALRLRGFDLVHIKSNSRNLGLQDERHPEADSRFFSLFLRRFKKWPILGRISGPLSWLEFVVRAVGKGSREKPALVVAFGLDALLPACLLKWLTSAPLFYYSDELYTDRPGVPMKPFWDALERRLIHRADLVCTCEPNRSRVLLERYGLKEMPMCVLNVPKRISPPSKRNLIQNYLQNMGLAGAKVVYYQGWISKARCADRLVEAMQYVTEPNAVLFFVGPIENSFREVLLEQARTLGLEKRVIIRGMVPSEELLDYAASADIGMQIQLDDGLNHYYCAPGKLFQYLAVGLPVIASNFPGMIDIVQKNNVGLCVDPEDPVSIGAAMSRLLEEDALRRKMAENALRLHQERFCYEVEGKPLIDRLDALANKNYG